MGLPRLARWYFRRVSGDGVDHFVFVLAVVFTASSLSHAVGVEPLIGAFLAGLALNRLIPPPQLVMNRIRFTGEAIFIPFVLLLVGMLLDVRVFLGGLRSWLVAIVMMGTVIINKWLAAESTRVFFRFSRDEARVVFGLSVAQAAATLAATMVGFEIRLFDETVVNGAILMILVTCILAPWTVSKHGRGMAAALQSAQPAAADESRLSAADVPIHPITRMDGSVAGAIARIRRELRISEAVLGWPGEVGPGGVEATLAPALAERGLGVICARLRHPLVERSQARSLDARLRAGRPSPRPPFWPTASPI